MRFLNIEKTHSRGEHHHQGKLEQSITTLKPVFTNGNEL